jgi:decaprenyl-phosphate phosphoribosyltransferase
MKIEDLHALHMSGMTIIVDVDGTIVPDKAANLPPDTASFLKQLAFRNDVYFASNGSPEHARKFAEEVGANFFECSKPFLSGVPEHVRMSPRKVVIGDKYLTDGLFAAALGAEFVKVDHARAPTDSFLIRASYVLDDFVWRAKAYFFLMRPWQWVKNLLVIAPVFFAGEFFDAGIFGKSIMAAFVFSAFASVTYIFNDVFDIEFDKKHPKKSLRPLAAGRISLAQAGAVAVVLLLLGFAGLVHMPSLAFAVACYVLINISYTLFLKNIPILDVVSVALCYVLRILAGGLAAHVYVSPWIILCVFFGSLFVILGKRLAEFTREHRRPVLEKYSREELSAAFTASGVSAILIYSIWSVLGHPSDYLVYSTFFVVVAILRVIHLIYRNDGRGESPEVLVFKDPVILSSFIAWLLYVAAIFVY